MEQSSSSTSSQSSQSTALQVRELDTNTDLNVAPADWLKGALFAAYFIHDTCLQDNLVVMLCLGSRQKSSIARAVACRRVISVE